MKKIPIALLSLLFIAGCSNANTSNTNSNSSNTSSSSVLENSGVLGGGGFGDLH